jgi:hypothetical protein
MLSGQPDSLAAMRAQPTLDVATEVWRTDGFRAIPYDDDGLRRAAEAVTTVDLFGNQPAGVPTERLSHRHRQQAGIDALIALAVPLVPGEKLADPRHEERYGGDVRRSR